MIEEGIYCNASELVRSAMRQFQEEHERKEMEGAQHLRIIGEEALAAIQRGEGKDISTPEDQQRVAVRAKSKIETAFSILPKVSNDSANSAMMRNTRYTSPTPIAPIRYCRAVSVSESESGGSGKV